MDDKDRVNELIQELDQSYLETRACQSSILQTLSICGASLGVLFGSNFLNKDAANVPLIPHLPDESALLYRLTSLITRSRVVFILECLIFCIAFAHVVSLGLRNLLLYYHSRDIEDRIHVYMDGPFQEKDDKGRGHFLHFPEFLAPVTTLNIRHIKSSHTVLNFVSVMVKMICLLLFSIGMVLVQYFMIDGRGRLDITILAITLLLIISTGFMFWRTCQGGLDAAKFAWNMGHENLEARKKGKPGYQDMNKGDRFIYRALYYVYPRFKTPQKFLIIVVGCVAGIMLRHPVISVSLIWNIPCIVFMFEFLAYAIRYQLNDLHGISEKPIPGQYRLFSSVQNEEQRVRNIRATLQVVYIRIIALVLLMVIGALYKWFFIKPFGIGLSILIVLTVAYEIARKMNWPPLVYILAGAGYPLRFFLGLRISQPTFWERFDLPTLFLLLGFLWAYGSMASLLSWAKQSEKLKGDISKEKRKHFQQLRYNLDEKAKAAGAEISEALRYRGSLLDPWNIFFILALVCVAMMSSFVSVLFLVGTVMAAASVMIGRKKRDSRFEIWNAGWILCLISIVPCLLSGNYPCAIAHAALVLTYCLIRYPVEAPWRSIVKVIKSICLDILEFMIGKDAYDRYLGIKQTLKTAAETPERKKGDTCAD